MIDILDGKMYLTKWFKTNKLGFKNRVFISVKSSTYYKLMFTINLQGVRQILDLQLNNGQVKLICTQSGFLLTIVQVVVGLSTAHSSAAEKLDKMPQFFHLQSRGQVKNPISPPGVYQHVGWVAQGSMIGIKFPWVTRSSD